MTEKERRIVEGWLREEPAPTVGSVGCSLGIGLLWVALVAMGAYIFAARYEIQRGSVFISGFSLSVWAAITGGVAAGVVYARVTFAQRSPRAGHRRQLRAGLVREERFAVTRAVRLVQARMTSGFAVEIGPRQVLCLEDSWLENLAAVPVPPFPGREIIIVRGLDDGPIITLACAGEPVPVERVVTLDPAQQRVPLAVTQLTGALDEIEALLTKPSTETAALE